MAIRDFEFVEVWCGYVTSSLDFDEFSNNIQLYDRIIGYGMLEVQMFKISLAMPSGPGVYYPIFSREGMCFSMEEVLLVFLIFLK